MLTVKGMALNRVLQKWVWRPVMLWIIVMSLHSFIFILIVTCFKSDYCNFLPEIFRIIPLHIFSQHIEMFFSSIPQHLRWVPWVVVDLEQSIPPTREFPKTISSIKQTNLWDEENLLPNTIIINTWMSNSYIVATLIYKLIQMGFWEPDERSQSNCIWEDWKIALWRPASLLVFISPRSSWHSAICCEISPYQFVVK